MTMSMRDVLQEHRAFRRSHQAPLQSLGWSAGTRDALV